LTGTSTVFEGKVEHTNGASVGGSCVRQTTGIVESEFMQS